MLISEAREYALGAIQDIFPRRVKQIRREVRQQIRQEILTMQATQSFFTRSRSAQRAPQRLLGCLILVIGALGLLAPSRVLAQSNFAQIQGTVTAEETGKPLGSVTVVVNGPALQEFQSEVTDNSGRYLITQLPPGDDYVVSFYFGSDDKPRVMRPGIRLSLGKTITTYGGIMEAGLWEGSHLVAAPKTTLKSVWADQLYRWAGDTGAEAFYMPDGKAKRQKVFEEFAASSARTKFLIINPEMLSIKKAHYCNKCEAFQGSYLAEHHQLGHRTSLQIQKCDWPDLFSTHWRTVTIDEVQKYLIGIRGPQKMTQVGTGATSLNADMRIALSGTPFKGVVRNLWGILHWLRPDEYKGFWSWAEMYLQVTDNGFGKEIGGLREGKEGAFYRSLDKIAIRRTKREVREDLPENVWQEHWVDMLPGQKKQYESMVEEAEAEFDGVVISTTGVLAELTRLKQLSFGEWRVEDGKLIPTEKSPKIDLVLEMLAERGVTGDPKTENGEMKYVIASQFTQVVNCVVEALEKRGIKCLVITGAVTGSRRAQAQKEFQSEGGARIMAINTTAGGVGIDLDAYCDEMFILDETWVPDEQKQVEGRIDNRGERVSTRFYHYIRTRETVEEGIANLNIDKDKIQSYILDKRRGVEFARNLIGRKSDG